MLRIVFLGVEGRIANGVINLTDIQEGVIAAKEGYPANIL